MQITITEQEYQELIQVKREYERLAKLEENILSKIRYLENETPGLFASKAEIKMALKILKCAIECRKYIV